MSVIHGLPSSDNLLQYFACVGRELTVTVGDRARLFDVISTDDLVEFSAVRVICLIKISSGAVVAGFGLASGIASDVSGGLLHGIFKRSVTDVVVVVVVGSEFAVVVVSVVGLALA